LDDSSSIARKKRARSPHKNASSDHLVPNIFPSNTFILLRKQKRQEFKVFFSVAAFAAVTISTIRDKSHFSSFLV
jgi:hypothetical protein